MILDAEFAARLDALNDEREHLLNTRERFPEHRTELTARLYVIGCELAELMPKSPTHRSASGSQINPLGLARSLSRTCAR